MRKNILKTSLVLVSVIGLVIAISAQSVGSSSIQETVSSLQLRSIGPALMGGRIADIAISPSDPNTWYVAAGSGNLWKSENAGITWDPIFDHQASYSIGVVTIDPINTEVIWVGTGENVSGRHVGWGDGVYKSTNGGKSWKQMGLSQSEHIGKILIDPKNSDVVLVAAEGPLWSSGGDRGVYRTEDGGQTWQQVLEIDENTGVTDIEFDPSNSDIIYGAAYQRRRQTWALMGGGPNSGIYKSTDNGKSWRKLVKGLPSGDMGKIGIGVTPANPDLVYATIEASDKEKGFYRSSDKGESWEKRNTYISGGTGPHYYQEIEVSPDNPDLIYQMDVFIHVSRDGGKTFDYLGTGREKHSDNHAMWIDPDNGQHLIAGTDAGLYESFDEGSHWRHFPNMPISQFYKLGLDNAEPFYNIIGGAQDLGTLIGPSRTMNAEGVRNQDWYVPLGADGYDSHFDPEDPNIAYMEIQQGLLHRYDKRTEEVINIQPQAASGDAPERWNWDSPILISPHDNHRLYFGSQRLWRSDDQGNSWTAISEDLTTNTNRYELPMTDRVWSVDALYDNGAMSKYATLTSITESPLEEGLLVTGSDDGLIHISVDGGANWKRSGTLPGVPERSFINDIEVSHYNADIIFAIADAHKFGDYNPYIFISSDRGNTWKSIAGDLPKGTIVWVLKQDHVDPNLLFIGTENGMYYSNNKGGNWVKLNGGVPTIPFRDIELHHRDHDLVGATFGRGFYVLDDYSALRNLQTAVNENVSTLFPVRDAWGYIPSVPMQAKGMPTLGSTSYRADNPPFGALITYYLDDVPRTTKSERKQLEKDLRKKEQDIPFPGWEALRQESNQTNPQALLLIKDVNGDPIKWIEGPAKKGLHRVNWNLRLAAPDPITLAQPAFQPPWAGNPQGPLAAPGKYSVELYMHHDGTLELHGEAQSFQVKPLPGENSNSGYEAAAKFQQETSELMRAVASAGRKLSEVNERLRYINAALKKTPKAAAEQYKVYNELKEGLSNLQIDLSGDPIRRRLDESISPSIRGRIGGIMYGHWDTRQAPTTTHKTSLDIASSDFQKFSQSLQSYFEKLNTFESTLEELGAPYTKGRRL